MSRAEEFLTMVRQSLTVGTVDEGAGAQFSILRRTIEEAVPFSVTPLNYYEAWDNERADTTLVPLPAEACFIGVVGESPEQDMYLHDEVTGGAIRFLGLFLSSADQQFRVWAALEAADNGLIFDALYLDGEWQEIDNRTPRIVPQLLRRVVENVH